MQPVKKADIVAGLQSDILRLQGFKPAGNNSTDPGLGIIKHAFPNSTFPLGALHEFLLPPKEAAAATTGFIAGLLSFLMASDGIALWISPSRTLFPPALRNFGIQPDRFIFIDVKKEKDAIWAMDEALKCGALTAVIGEIRDLTFTESRRLQLAVEQSQVTGFILRSRVSNPGTTACVSRWKVSTQRSDRVEGELPGIGFPKWKVELLKIKNGKPGTWEVQWLNGKFNVTKYSMVESFLQQELEPESSFTPTAKAG